MPTTGFALRLAALAIAFVIGPATLAPGTAEAPSAALAGDGTTAAQRFGWRTMQWDFAWEFGESLSSGPYRGENIRGGSWVEHSDGTGRVAKYGGGLEFHSGERYDRARDFGTTTLTLQGKPGRLGRWELRERIRLEENNATPYTFVAELIPENPADRVCGAPTITIARAVVGGSTIRIGGSAGSAIWSRTLSGYGRGEGTGRLYAVQVTSRRITWFVNGLAVASLGALSAIPKVPMTVRLRMVGDGAKEMNKSHVLIDWVRHYDLDKGLLAPKALALTKATSGGC